jgi:anaerobic magnesium-protoporphyrin IX monomethyl ester cyclase
MDALLINPPLKVENPAEHLGLGYLAAMLRAKGNYDVEIIDAPLNGLSLSETVKEIAKRQFKVLGISIPYQQWALVALQMANMLRARGLKAHITVGGFFPSFAYENLLKDFPSIDSVIRGEGEETFLDLVTALVQGDDWRQVKGIAYREGDEVVCNPTRPLIGDLDSLPFPERDTLPSALRRCGYAGLLSSRGCYARCTFCSVVSFYGIGAGPKYRARSTQNVVDEIAQLQKEFGVTKFFFHDANFIGPGRAGKDRAWRLADEIISRGLQINFSIQCRADDVEEELFSHLKEAGLRRVFIGIESGVQEALDRFKKGVTIAQNLEALEILKRLGLNMAVGFIMFDPDTKLEDIMDNIAFLREAGVFRNKRATVDLLNRLQIFAGTPIEKALLEQGRLRGTYLHYEYDIADPAAAIVCTVTRRLANLKMTVKKITGFRERPEL